MAEIVSISSEAPVALGETVSTGSVDLSPVYGASPVPLDSVGSQPTAVADAARSLRPTPVDVIESKSPVAWYPAGEASPGNSWWYGDGPPSSEIPAVSGDLYYDTLTGNVYSFE